MNRYIADLHFGSEKALKQDGRKFSSVAEMDEYMIEAWNAVVHPKDTVYIIGDFCAENAGRWMVLLRRLKGKKVLVRGIDDPHPTGKLRNMFQDVQDNMRIQDHGRKVFLNHIPVCDETADEFRLCGSIHAGADNVELTKFREKTHRHVYNCFCMFQNYTPYTLDQIIRDNEGD